VLPCGIASNDLLLMLKSILREKTTLTKQNKSLRVKNSNQEINERINRSNFFFNITTSMNHIDAFFSIGTMYPLIQLNDTGNAPKIKYLCIAGNDEFI
jgi:hypothetical protein